MWALDTNDRLEKSGCLARTRTKMFFNTGLTKNGSGPQIGPQELGADWHGLARVVALKVSANPVAQSAFAHPLAQAKRGRGGESLGRTYG